MWVCVSNALSASAAASAVLTGFSVGLVLFTLPSWKSAAVSSRFCVVLLKALPLIVKVSSTYMSKSSRTWVTAVCDNATPGSGAGVGTLDSANKPSTVSVAVGGLAVIMTGATSLPVPTMSSVGLVRKYALAVCRINE